jgi:hypothetical protein
MVGLATLIILITKKGLKWLIALLWRLLVYISPLPFVLFFFYILPINFDKNKILHDERSERITVVIIFDELDIESYFNTCLPYTLELYNRWGNLVYEQKLNGEPFKGVSSNGEKVNQGVYFYRLVFKEGEKTGFLQVMY